MNEAQIGLQAQRLLHRMQQQKKQMDQGVFETLAELMTLAEASNDDAFLGYVHYHMADSTYAFEVDYGEFRHHIGRAIVHLQKAGEDALLTRAINYAGVDASNNGNFDVAYFHMMNALNICEASGDEYLQSIVNNNIGQIYARIGNYEKALEYVRWSNELQQRATAENDIYFYQNMINGIFSEGVLNIQLNNLPGAKEAEERIRILEEKSGNPGLTNVSIPVSFLRLQIAILDGDVNRIEQYRTESMRIICDAHRLFDYITDINDLCRFLVEDGHLSIVRAVLDAISDPIKDAGVYRMQQMLSAMEVAYYEKTGEQEKLMQHLLDHHHASAVQENEQNRIHQLSIEIVDTMNELRRERSALEEQARTDSLTGIPNRYGMEYSINRIFHHALREGTSFAIEILDINGFKEYNDTYGHQAGDECLKVVAGAIAALSKKEGITCARYGGDEFVLVTEGRDAERLRAIAGELNEMLKERKIPHEKDKVSGFVTVSQGICSGIPDETVQPWDYLAVADKNLYQSKQRYYEEKQRNAITLSSIGTVVL